MAKVLLKFKESVLKEIPIERSEVTIGRNPNNDIPIENLAVSGFHAKIVKYPDGFYIEDQNSLNGTFLNERKVSKSILKANDKITIGKHVLVFTPSASDESIPIAESKAGPAMEATMVLQTKEHKAMLAKSDKPAAAEPLGVFAVIEGSAEKPEYELTGRLTTIGKAETSTIKLKGLFAPKVAALVNRTKDGYIISPPGAGAKVKINGNQVEGRYTLKDGDIIELSGLKLQFYSK